MKRTSMLIALTLALALVVALPAPAATVNCSGVSAWNSNFVTYAIGALVTYNGSEYKCIQAHTSEPGWDPADVPALWSLVGTCGSGGATPTPTPKGTATPTPKGTATATPKSTPTATAKPTATATAKPTATATPSGGTTIKNVQVTFYGWYDNSPPGNGIAYPKNGGFPTDHNVATAGGTFSNPSSFATDAQDGEFKVGAVIYVPYMKKYFILEDECVQCESDWKNSREYHVDLWAGGNTSANETDLINCEDNLTSSGPDATIILNPPSNESVDTNQIFNSSTNQCENITPP